MIEANYYQLTNLFNILLQPVFLYERPSYKGFFILSMLWENILPQPAKIKNWKHIAVQFHQNLPKATFMSVNCTPQTNSSIGLQLAEVITTDLVEVTSATTSFMIEETTLYIEFKWEKSKDTTHPQLMIQIRTHWDDYDTHKMLFVSSSIYS